ncbi:MAG: hypothetical protein LBT40_11520 [Deltaproteobacteria bacterium]|jgi:hypothetical protein|nr:hypothetical protein [Deltaproteobacteria bacterium]
MIVFQRPCRKAREELPGRGIPRGASGKRHPERSFRGEASREKLPGRSFLREASGVRHPGRSFLGGASWERLPGMSCGEIAKWHIMILARAEGKWRRRFRECRLGGI